ncbi:putative iron-sulfur cluster assembly protein [Oscillibacter valericigenes Sjm18-20]|nr:putative iron-sulfur cluster assembly protein [Oscillibacter valericigenes Sjm18-20]
MKSYINILEVRDLCVQAGGKNLLDHLNLTIPDGEVHALLGQNGSGKTSLMMTIMGFSGYTVTQGQILYKGQDITEFDICERARLGIAIAQQRPSTIDGVKLRSVLLYILRNEENPEERLVKLAQTANMEGFLDRSVNDGLSGGEIKRAELLQLLAMSPVFSMMDEPDSGVDIESLALVGGLINKLFSPDEKRKAKRNSGLIITHNGKILELFNIDKAHVMHNGSIGCSGNPAIILDTISKYGYEECVRCIGRQ